MPLSQKQTSLYIQTLPEPFSDAAVLMAPVALRARHVAAGPRCAWASVCWTASPTTCTPAASSSQVNQAVTELGFMRAVANCYTVMAGTLLLLSSLHYMLHSCCWHCCRVLALVPRSGTDWCCILPADVINFEQDDDMMVR